MNFEAYPWLRSFDSAETRAEIAEARSRYQKNGAVVFPHFLTDEALQQCVMDAKAKEDDAFTTDDMHTAYLKPLDIERFGRDSVYNHEMRTLVASTAYDELPKDSALRALYHDPLLLTLVAAIVGKEELFLSEDPLGCCSINVFRPGYYHSFHFDESEFSTTIMLQEAENTDTGLFQYTDPLRGTREDLALPEVAEVLRQYDPDTLSLPHGAKVLSDGIPTAIPPLHTLDFRPGTLSIFRGSSSLHRVTEVKGKCSRLVAVLTFATRPGFRNSEKVQRLFWGRAASH